MSLLVMWKKKLRKTVRINFKYNPRSERVVLDFKFAIFISSESAGDSEFERF